MSLHPRTRWFPRILHYRLLCSAAS
jgi:hypothetical protein